MAGIIKNILHFLSGCSIIIYDNSDIDTRHNIYTGTSTLASNNFKRMMELNESLCEC